MDNATTNYLCHYCGVQFTTSTTLKLHIEEIHAEDKLYKCGKCDQTFNNENRKRRHEKTHTAVKSLCEFCGKLFATKSHLKAHIKAKHTIDKNYKCNMCGKIFKTKYRLYCHKKTEHTHERSYKCDQCSATFLYLQHLKQHMKTHNSKRLYPCEICGKNFRKRSELNNHRLVHSDEKPHDCWVCSKSYKRKYALSRHTETKGHWLNPYTKN